MTGAVTLAFAVTLAARAGACGGGDQEEAPALPADPARALAQSASALREEGTFAFEASFTRVKVTAPDDVEEYATSKGALNLGAGAGRAELDLSQLASGLEENPIAYDAKAAGRRGIPAELSEAFERALYGPTLELEAWIEDDGLPHKVSYAIRLKPLRGTFNRVLPARTIRVTYELGDFGDGFDPNG